MENGSAWVECFDDQGEEILGEVYEVDETTLNRLDRLEGYNHLSPESGLYNKM